ncbi:MAG TPA: hypothetical protein VGR38_03925, partial [Candidatus Polarisedimenticolia bacterium]|nr:hypothetical protein [Candidatus Polarisedimenticolia bacterium]
EATSDPTTDWIPEGYDVAPMAAPRVCDAAALVLSERLGIGADFTWPASIRTRNRNIEIILNRWRRSKGLPPVEYLGPGIEPVPSEKVRGLVPELISAEVAVREAAIVKLSELGPGAWRTLLGEIERAPDASRSVLEASTTRAANTLRSVVFENAAAERLAPGLKSRMHRPIDVNALVNLIGEPWFDDPDSGKLMCVVSRGADGIGVSIRLSLEPPCPPGSRTVGIEFEYGGGSSWSRLEGGVPFRTDFRQRLERISTVLDRPDLQAEVEFTVERTFKD